MWKSQNHKHTTSYPNFSRYQSAYSEGYSTKAASPLSWTSYLLILERDTSQKCLKFTEYTKAFTSIESSLLMINIVKSSTKKIETSLCTAE